MAIYTGKVGKIYFGGTQQARVKNWTVEGSVAMLDTTDLGRDAVHNEAGLKSFSGSATIMYHNDDNKMALLLNNIFTTAIPTAAQLRFEWGGKFIEFPAFISGASLAMAAGEIMTADITFIASGDVQFTGL